MTASYNRTLVPMADGYYSSREITRLRAALPLIIDCIKAAEQYLAQLDADQEASGAAMQDHLLPYRQRELRLRGSLTALQERLGAGDG